MTPVQLDIDALEITGTEIARYRVAEGERVLMGRQGLGGAELVDVPADGSGASYRVDRGHRDGAVLAAFVSDYVEQAGRLDRCPMGGETIKAILADTESEVVDDLVAAIWSK